MLQPSAGDAARVAGHERPAPEPLAAPLGPNVSADSGSSFVDDSTPSTFTTGLTSGVGGLAGGMGVEAERETISDGSTVG